jgi:excisionase family DNA binding protein
MNLLLPQEAADRGRVPLSTFYYLMRTGRGPKAIKLGRHYRILESDFLEWLANK